MLHRQPSYSHKTHWNIHFVNHIADNIEDKGELVNYSSIEVQDLLVKTDFNNGCFFCFFVFISLFNAFLDLHSQASSPVQPMSLWVTGPVLAGQSRCTGHQLWSWQLKPLLILQFPFKRGQRCEDLLPGFMLVHVSLLIVSSPSR